jgi:hypothetical protein
VLKLGEIRARTRACTIRCITTNTTISSTTRVSTTALVSGIAFATAWSAFSINANNNATIDININVDVPTKQQCPLSNLPPAATAAAAAAPPSLEFRLKSPRDAHWLLEQMKRTRPATARQSVRPSTGPETAVVRARASEGSKPERVRGAVEHENGGGERDEERLRGYGEGEGLGKRPPLQRHHHLRPLCPAAGAKRKTVVVAGSFCSRICADVNDHT